VAPIRYLKEVVDGDSEDVGFFFEVRKAVKLPQERAPFP